MEPLVVEAFQYVSDGILILDENRHIVYLNPAAERLTGWRREELIGQDCGALFGCRDERGRDACGTFCFGQRALTWAEPVTEGEVWIRTRDGTRRPVSNSYAAIPPSESHGRLAVMVMRDVSERKEAEEEARRMHERLVEASRRQRRRAELLRDLSMSLAAVADVRERLGGLAETVRLLLRADAAGWVIDETTLAALGLDGQRARGSAGTPVDGPFLDHLLQLGRPYRFPGQQGEVLSAHVLEHRFASFASVPVWLEGRVVALLYAASRGPREFDEEDVTLLGHVAGVLGMALQNLRLYQSVRELAVLEERSRLGREIHDGIAQTLAFVRLMLADLRQRVGREAGEAVRRAVEDSLRAVEQANREVRQAIYDLRVLSGGGDIESALGQYLADFPSRAGVRLETTLAPDALKGVPHDVCLQVLRILQEALANVRKHARANAARVALWRDDVGLCLEVVDDGRGFDAEVVGQAGHFGLASMAERARAIGGDLTVRSAPGQGTTVRLTVPVPAVARAG
ncbi:MAG: PAS domain S-box protein [Clostridia bacterium]|nr:PAS domain S-box protein [Clostridia bacterium]